MMTSLFSWCRLTKSDFREPVNIGSDEGVSMNQMAEYVMDIAGKNLPIKHIPGPEGVRGRNSNNTLIKEKLGWAPSMKLKVRLNLCLPEMLKLCSFQLDHFLLVCSSFQMLFAQIETFLAFKP